MIRHGSKKYRILIISYDPAINKKEILVIWDVFLCFILVIEA